jgi:EAL domain-containing protein (putative c-di-GMP-specific phosphodiesterase class I)
VPTRHPVRLRGRRFLNASSIPSRCGQRADARLVIDDLGAGFSNLRLIADLEPAIVKLDRSLVMNIHLEKRKQQLVKSIVQLCVDMSAQVVAEGIELPEELEVIRDTGAHYGQGFLFARPGFPLPMHDQLELP